jgi:hypothetical protein
VAARSYALCLSLGGVPYSLILLIIGTGDLSGVLQLCQATVMPPLKKWELMSAVFP